MNCFLFWESCGLILFVFCCLSKTKPQVMNSVFCDHQATKAVAINTAKFLVKHGFVGYISGIYLVFSVTCIWWLCSGVRFTTQTQEAHSFSHSLWNLQPVVRQLCPPLFVITRTVSIDIKIRIRITILLQVHNSGNHSHKCWHKCYVWRNIDCDFPAKAQWRKLWSSEHSLRMIPCTLLMQAKQLQMWWWRSKNILEALIFWSTWFICETFQHGHFLVTCVIVKHLRGSRYVIQLKK